MKMNQLLVMGTVGLVLVLLPASCVDDPDSLQHSYAGVCVPDCDGKECGDDGCDGSCGSCSEGTCVMGSCGCIPSCEGKECGGDGCTGSCGSCSEGTCVMGSCGCIPSCEGKECGGDGCTGSCGDCGTGSACDVDQCIEDECEPVCAEGACGSDGCGGSCGPCSGGAVCVDDLCCLADCTGKECGNDGCGGSCGNCVEPDPFCMDHECVADCTADCAGKECGNDGCGGSCGECTGAQETCDHGICECIAECSGKECGGDGCGGLCGECSEDGFVCENGYCVSNNVCGDVGTIAGLRTCPEGPVSMTIEDVVVTYVFDSGYFVADNTACIEVYVGLEWSYPKPVLGQILTLAVTELGSFKGMMEVMHSEAPALQGNTEVDAFVNDISEGTLPSEKLESCVVAAAEIQVVNSEGKNHWVNYGTAQNVRLRDETESGYYFCSSALLGLKRGVITQYDDEHYMKVYGEGDIEITSIGDCPGPGDDSNWDFEETEENDPPADFEKQTPDFTATWTAEQAHGGANSCELTWFSADNQDLYQGYYMPITPGQLVTFHVWVLDEDPAGRLRQRITFYSSTFQNLYTEYSSTYTEVSANWTLYEVQFSAPADAAYVRAGVRMYDVSADWDGDATVFIDDWNVAID